MYIYIYMGWGRGFLLRRRLHGPRPLCGRLSITQYDVMLYIYIYTYVYMHIHICIHTCIDIHIWICIHICVHVCAYIYIYTYMYIYTHLSLYIYIYIYISLSYTYMHTSICIKAAAQLAVHHSDLADKVNGVVLQRARIV